MLTMFQNYVDNIALSPRDEYLGLMQASIDSQWDMSTQRYKILEQNAIGSDEYTLTDISVDIAIELSTGTKKSDDFKTFAYKDIEKDIVLGLMYQWENNYWIITSTDEYGSPTKASTVRRCNNIAKWVNPENGAIMSQRCCIDYDLQSPYPRVNKDLEVANGHIVLIIQGNSDTLEFLDRNQRLIFNGNPYKVTAINDMLQNDIVDDSTTLLYYDLYADVELPTDDIKNNIANRYEYNYGLTIINPPNEQTVGATGSLIAQVKLNGETVDRDVVWTSIDGCNLDSDGNYNIYGEVGTIAKIKATLGDIVQYINIQIVENISDNYEIVIYPFVSEILQTESKEFSVSLYNNEDAQSDIVTYEVTGASSSNYTIVQNGNNFTVTNLLVSQIPLTIKFTSGEYSKSIDITLKALF